MEAMDCLAKLSGETKGICYVAQVIRCVTFAGNCRFLKDRLGLGRCIGPARNEKIEGMIAEMTAAVLYGKEDLRLERVAVPQAGPGKLGGPGGGGGGAPGG